ncbi:hypothetical protein AGLY_006365, partial [Aphis glycines]
MFEFAEKIIVKLTINFILDSERSDECIDFTMIITSRNNASISNFGGGLYYREKKVGKWVPFCCTLGGGVDLGLGVDKIFLALSKYWKILYKILTKIRQNYEYLQIILYILFENCWKMFTFYLYNAPRIFTFTSETTPIILLTLTFGENFNITSRNNASISNFGGGFRWKSEYPWCIIEIRHKNEIQGIFILRN